MAVLFISIGFMAVFFILMSVRLLFVKNGEFRGTCASQSPWLNKEGASCGYCGRNLEEGDSCGKDELDSFPLPEIGKK